MPVVGTVFGSFKGWCKRKFAQAPFSLRQVRGLNGFAGSKVKRALLGGMLAESEADAVSKVCVSYLYVRGVGGPPRTYGLGVQGVHELQVSGEEARTSRGLWDRLSGPVREQLRPRQGLQQEVLCDLGAAQQQAAVRASETLVVPNADRAARVFIPLDGQRKQPAPFNFILSPNEYNQLA